MFLGLIQDFLSIEYQQKKQIYFGTGSSGDLFISESETYYLDNINIDLLALLM